MTLFVLDASVALAIIFEDEISAYADAVAVILKQDQAVVPLVWPLEIANALLTAVRRGRIPEADAPLLIGIFDRLRIEIDSGIALANLAQTTFSLGIAHRVSAYDATYLELAIRRGLPLATQDERLARAAANAGVVILRP
jgi:predicted nucleic acid-binding protein